MYRPVVQSSRLSASLFAAIVLAASVFFSGCFAKNNAGLQILSNDLPSSVYIDGKLAEKTPYIQKDLKAGEYSIEIRPDDTTYLPYQTKVSLKRGMLTVISWKPGKRAETSGGVIFETEPLQDKKATELIITTIPDGGIIYVDDVAKGFAPVTIQGLSPGEHRFEVRLPSYETQSHPINILEGYRILVTAKLGKQDYQTPRPNTASDSAALNSAETETASNSASATSSARPATSPSASPKASPTVASASSSTNLPPPKVVIQSTNFFQAGKEVLRVRSDASAGSAEIGYAPVGAEYPYAKEVKDGWVKIDFEDQAGWVSKQFVNVVE